MHKEIGINRVILRNLIWCRDIEMPLSWSYYDHDTWFIVSSAFNALNTASHRLFVVLSTLLQPTRSVLYQLAVFVHYQIVPLPTWSITTSDQYQHVPIPTSHQHHQCGQLPTHSSSFSINLNDRVVADSSKDQLAVVRVDHDRRAVGFNGALLDGGVYLITTHVQIHVKHLMSVLSKVPST